MTRIHGALLHLLRCVGIWVDTQPRRGHYEWYISRKADNLQRLMHDIAILGNEHLS
jgi:hypothetical protein